MKNAIDGDMGRVNREWLPPLEYSDFYIPNLSHLLHAAYGGEWWLVDLHILVCSVSVAVNGKRKKLFCIVKRENVSKFNFGVATSEFEANTITNPDLLE